MCASCERRPCVIGEDEPDMDAHLHPLLRDIRAAYARPIIVEPVEPVESDEPRCPRCNDRQARARICARCERELDAMGRDLARGDA